MKTILIAVIALFVASPVLAKPFYVGGYLCGSWNNRADKVIINDCPQLEDLIAGSVAPTPVPTAIPTVTPTPTLTPTPTVKPASCESVALVNKTQRSITVSLDYNVERRFCFDIPADSTNGLVEIRSVNLANASCSDVRMTVTSPLGQVFTSNGSQPGIVGVHATGRWVMAVTQFPLPDQVGQDETCNRYVFTANW